MGSCPAPKTLQWLGSCPTLCLGWAHVRTESAVLGGLPFTSTDSHDFRIHRPRIGIVGLAANPRRFVAHVYTCVITAEGCNGRGSISPAADTVFASVLSYPPRAARPPPRSPGCSDDRLTADSFTKKFYTGGGLRRHRRSDRVRLCLAWHSIASVGDAAFKPHLNLDASTSSDSNRKCTPRCRLWLRAQRGPSTIFQMRHNPAASPTVAADPVDRRDPCSCRLAGPHGATTIRPRPRRAYMGTPLLRLTPLPGDTPTAHTRYDALGDAADLQFPDSVARYSHAD